MPKMNNNIKLLLSLLIATVLVGGYLLFLAPVVYKGNEMTKTREEYNALVAPVEYFDGIISLKTRDEHYKTYRVGLDRAPLVVDDFLTQELWGEWLPSGLGYSAVVKRGYPSPYGGKSETHMVVGFCCIGVSVVSLIALGWEAKHQ